MSIHIHWTEPLAEVKREPDGAERHCFRCRTRRRFEYVVRSPVARSSYGPTHQIECAVCRTVDADLFPGRRREWGE